MKKRRFPDFRKTALALLLLPGFLLQASEDQAKLEALLSAASARGGGVAHVPAGTYRLTRPLTIPEGVELRGESAASVRLIAPQDTPFPAILLRGISHAGVSRLQLLEEDHRYRGKSPAIAIEGESRSIFIREVTAKGFSSGFSMGREDAGTLRHIMLENCRAEASSSFGFEFNNVSGAYMENCHSFHHRLDGIKLRKQTRDVTITGGDSSHNGWFNPKLNGNGIDAFAGGNNWVVRDLVNEHNNGSGIYLKTGRLQHTGFGTVENAQIFNVRSRHNKGSGVDINRSGGDLPTDGGLSPLLSHVVVVGGISEDNQSSGYYVRARKVTFLAPFSQGNRLHGIDLASAWDVSVVAPGLRLSSPSTPGDPTAPRFGLQTGIDPVIGIARRIAIFDGHVGSQPLSDDTFSPAPALAAWNIGPESRHILIHRFTAQLPGGLPGTIAPEALQTTHLAAFPLTTP